MSTSLISHESNATGPSTMPIRGILVSGAVCFSKDAASCPRRPPVIRKKFCFKISISFGQHGASIAISRLVESRSINPESNNFRNVIESAIGSRRLNSSDSELTSSGFGDWMSRDSSCWIDFPVTSNFRWAGSNSRLCGLSGRRRETWPPGTVEPVA